MLQIGIPNRDGIKFLDLLLRRIYHGEEILILQKDHSIFFLQVDRDGRVSLEEWLALWQLD
jgi:hypothetical protein